jgi:hypothetical protein
MILYQTIGFMWFESVNSMLLVYRALKIIIVHNFTLLFFLSFFVVAIPVRVPVCLLYPVPVPVQIENPV